MPAIFEPQTETALVHDYDDGPGGPRSSVKKECAFRDAFWEEASRVVRLCARRYDKALDLPALERAAHQERLAVRESHTVYGAGRAGRKTHHLGYKPGHEVPAARLRGRHHALVYILDSTRHSGVPGTNAPDPVLLSIWLKAVGDWTYKPNDPCAIFPPPRPLDVPGVLDYLTHGGPAPVITSGRAGGLKCEPLKADCGGAAQGGCYPLNIVN